MSAAARHIIRGQIKPHRRVVLSMSKAFQLNGGADLQLGRPLLSERPNLYQTFVCSYYTTPHYNITFLSELRKAFRL